MVRLVWLAGVVALGNGTRLFLCVLVPLFVVSLRLLVGNKEHKLRRLSVLLGGMADWGFPFLSLFLSLFFCVCLGACVFLFLTRAYPL